MPHIHEWIELAGQGIEALAVAIMVSFIFIGTLRWLFHSLKDIEGAYERYRVVLGKTLLIGLELLVAADILFVRTALGWTLTVEVEGHWPWQKTKESLVGLQNEPQTHH